MADTDERATPIELFNELDDEFYFDVDVCATKENAKCARYYTKEDDAFAQKWSRQNCFMNPPYSNIERWLNKAKFESERGALVVAILPMDSSTEWFHKYIWDKIVRAWRVPVILPDKRYAFGDNVNSAKFATLIAIFGSK